jgi:hypothetical protein
MMDFDTAALRDVPEESPRFRRILEQLSHELVAAAKRADLPALYSTDGQGERSCG